MSDNQNSTSLNKYISDTGYCSRREADVIIKAGRVTINGVMANPGNRVSEGDEVLLDGKRIFAKPKRVYIALNKPRGITCTTDLRVKGNIIDYMDYPERIFPIGRLDKPSTGLILLTNDGDIVNKILRGSNNHDKEYIVDVHKAITNDFIQGMSGGVPILDTITKKCKVEKISKYRFKIILTQGLNRQIRRMCEHFGYRVSYLERVRIMNIKLGRLAMGDWRYLSKNEMTQLNALLSDSKKN